jgi:cytochrome c oxidase subunit 4
LVGAALIAWLVLMLLLGAELLATLAHAAMLALPVGLAMACVVAMGFMHLRSTSPLSRIFATAGLFWLIVLLTLGTMDPLTRTDYPVRNAIDTASPARP